MQKRDILQAGYMVWGAQCYKKMNLSAVAKALGVTKPALYRYFVNKDAILNELFVDFFYRLSQFLTEHWVYTEQIPDPTEQVLQLVLRSTEYFAHNKNNFIFSLSIVLGSTIPQYGIEKEFARRNLVLAKDDAYFAALLTEGKLCKKPQSQVDL